MRASNRPFSYPPSVYQSPDVAAASIGPSSHEAGRGTAVAFSLDAMGSYAGFESATRLRESKCAPSRGRRPELTLAQPYYPTASLDYDPIRRVDVAASAAHSHLTPTACHFGDFFNAVHVPSKPIASSKEGDRRYRRCAPPTTAACNSSTANAGTCPPPPAVPAKCHFRRSTMADDARSVCRRRRGPPGQRFQPMLCLRRAADDRAQAYPILAGARHIRARIPPQ